jgi:hypothetical protein
MQLSANMKLSQENLKDENLFTFVDFCLNNTPEFEEKTITISHTRGELEIKARVLGNLAYHPRVNNLIQKDSFFFPTYTVTHLETQKAVEHLFTGVEARLLCQMLYHSDLDWSFKKYSIVTFSHEEKLLLRETFSKLLGQAVLSHLIERLS